MNDNVHGNRHSDGGLWRAATAGRRRRYDVFYRVTGGDGVVYGVSMLQYSNLSTTQASCRFRSKSRMVNVERIRGEKGSSRPQRAYFSRFGAQDGDCRRTRKDESAGQKQMATREVNVAS